MSGLLVCAALAIEARALRRGLGERAGDARVVRTGLGARRAGRAVALLGEHGSVAVAGFGGAVDEGLQPGDVLVASEVRFGGRVFACHGARLLAAELLRTGLPVRTGPLVTCDRLVTGAERGRLAGGGARAVDMEAGPLAAAVAGLPFAAVRVIVDTPSAPLVRPGTVRRGLAGMRTLRRLGPVLARWAAIVGPRAGRAAGEALP